MTCTDLRSTHAGQIAAGKISDILSPLTIGNNRNVNITIFDWCMPEGKLHLAADLRSEQKAWRITVFSETLHIDTYLQLNPLATGSPVDLIVTIDGPFGTKLALHLKDIAEIIAAAV
jgi:hypothetical protein